MTDNTAVLLRQDQGGIATLTLNRPEAYNALSVELLGALQDAFDAISEDHGVRVVVLGANGKAFSAGHDLKEMRANPAKQAMGALFDQASSVMQTMLRMPQPVIARVHGLATAAGCQLVATCDLAVAAEEARFATSGIKVGLFCATPMVALTRNIPAKHAMEMLMTGDFVDARQALASGLVNRVVAAEGLDAAVAGLAAAIAAKSPAAVALGKRLFYRQLEAGLEQAYAWAGETMCENMMSADAGEGIDAFLNKKPGAKK
jgi:enoyl-CoA hydratase/carnithine racemase